MQAYNTSFIVRIQPQERSEQDGSPDFALKKKIPLHNEGHNTANVCD